MTLRRRLWPLLASLAIIAFLFAVVLPTRTFLSQRHEMAAEEAKVRVLTRENQRLASRVSQLHTDSEIERIAREQYNLVRPGEEAYAILPGPADADADAEVSAAQPAAETAGPWWQRVWESLDFWN